MASTDSTVPALLTTTIIEIITDQLTIQVQVQNRQIQVVETSTSDLGSVLDHHLQLYPQNQPLQEHQRLRSLAVAVER